jgi:bifunctional oligoribonuclease and PAP phosphatase NrnA
MDTTTAIEQIASELACADKLLLGTHENPDGDALGSLVATHEILRRLGKDVLMFLSEQEWPLPHEYQYLGFGGALHTPPHDIGERVLVLLDCGNIERSPMRFVGVEGQHTLNIDHHHDNTRFGSLNLVVPEASSTAEIVWELAKGLDAELTPGIAEALYVAMVTDTGKFMYTNTSPRAHRMAAELLEAGVDPAATYRRLYENVPFNRLQLLGRALGRLQRRASGALTVAYLSRSDYLETLSKETDSDGIIDQLRATEGTAVAVLVRELISETQTGTCKVSLRAANERVDVSAIARTYGGGGHRQAAGFSTALELSELIADLERAVLAQL